MKTTNNNSKSTQDCDPVTEKTFKKKQKKITPKFIRSSLISKSDQHAVQAVIKNGLEIYKYEESFSSKELAQCMIETINADPKIAIKFLNKAKRVHYKDKASDRNKLMD